MSFLDLDIITLLKHTKHFKHKYKGINYKYYINSVMIQYNKYKKHNNYYQ